jgi:glycosyltransferase involved in cell wall biosynthesis
VYDDGSTEDTYELARKVGATVIKNPKNTGYGAAIRELSKLLA